MRFTEEEWAVFQGQKQAQEPRPHAPKGKPAKYRNQRVTVDLGPSGEIVNGHLRLIHEFDSKREAQTFHELKLRRTAGEISGLRLQEPFALVARGSDGFSGVIVGEWLADFVYMQDGTPHVIDAKGMKTQTYQLKKKIVEACHGITIEEV
jgi:Protein of unknown function (DUF1064)